MSSIGVADCGVCAGTLGELVGQEVYGPGGAGVEIGLSMRTRVGGWSGKVIRGFGRAVPSCPSSRSGTPLSAKLCFVRAARGSTRHFMPRMGKRSFQDTGIPKQELGNEEEKLIDSACGESVEASTSPEGKWFPKFHLSFAGIPAHPSDARNCRLARRASSLRV